LPEKKGNGHITVPTIAPLHIGTVALHMPKLALQWLWQPYEVIFGVWSHRFGQYKSAIGWLQWLQHKLYINLNSGLFTTWARAQGGGSWLVIHTMQK
jgi:hypothetical protein